MNKGIDGFRIDAVPHIFEHDDLLDEPRSNKPGVGEKDYGYLNHIYTFDDPRNYDLVKSWRKVLDDWADSHNEDEKVFLSIKNYILYIFLRIENEFFSRCYR